MEMKEEKEIDSDCVYVSEMVCREDDNSQRPVGDSHADSLEQRIPTRSSASAKVWVQMCLPVQRTEGTYCVVGRVIDGEMEENAGL